MTTDQLMMFADKLIDRARVIAPPGTYATDLEGAIATAIREVLYGIAADVLALVPETVQLRSAS